MYLFERKTEREKRTWEREKDLLSADSLTKCLTHVGLGQLGARDSIHVPPLVAWTRTVGPSICQDAPAGRSIGSGAARSLSSADMECVCASSLCFQSSFLLTLILSAAADDDGVPGPALPAAGVNQWMEPLCHSAFQINTNTHTLNLQKKNQHHHTNKKSHTWFL